MITEEQVQELKERLKETGLRHKKVYEILGISYSYFSHMINGTRECNHYWYERIEKIVPAYEKVKVEL